MPEQIEKQLDLLADVDKSENVATEPSPAPEKEKGIFDDIEDPDCKYCGDVEGGCAQCGFGRNKK